MSPDRRAEVCESGRAIRVRKGSGGRSTVIFTDGWTRLTSYPIGGSVLSRELDALGRSLVQPDLLVLSVFYLRPASPGKVLLRTETFHEDHRTSSGSVVLEQEGREMVRATATYGDLVVGGREPRLDGAAEVAYPEDSHPALGPEGSMEGSSAAHRVEYRHPDPFRRSGTLRDGPDRDGFWMRFADVRSLPAMVDFAALAVPEAGESGSVTVELTTHFLARPVPGWLVARIYTRFVSHGLHEEYSQILEEVKGGTGALRGGALATFEVEGERFRVWTTNPQTIHDLHELPRLQQRAVHLALVVGEDPQVGDLVGEPGGLGTSGAHGRQPLQRRCAAGFAASSLARRASSLSHSVVEMLVPFWRSTSK
jgi:hypothetical protein